MSLPNVRVRRLAGKGPFGLRRVFEVEYSQRPDDATTTTTTTRPSDVIKPLLGWDEASLVVRRASEAWRGGTGPWCAGLTGEIEEN